MIRLALPFAARLAVATPNARSSHTVPIPQSGGLFLFAAVSLSSLVVCIFQPDLRKSLIDILLPALALAMIGWIDDRRGLQVSLRLLVFLLVSLLASFASGYSIHFVIAALMLLVMINVTNFMDGIDGMVVAEFVPMLVMFGILSVFGFLGETSGLLSVILAGALTGFFLFNRPRAKIFLGDSGALVVGLLAGIFLIECAEKNGWLATLILPAYFLGDAGLTLLFRTWRGEKIWRPHRMHFYQRALDAGQSNWSIIGRVTLCNLALCVLSYGAINASVLLTLSLFVSGGIIVLILLYSLSRSPWLFPMPRDEK